MNSPTTEAGQSKFVTKAYLMRSLQKVAHTMGQSLGKLVKKALDDRLKLEREHTLEIIRAELEARLPPATAASQDERRLQ